MQRALPALGFEGVEPRPRRPADRARRRGPRSAAGDVREAAGQPADRGLRGRQIARGEVRRRPFPGLVRRGRRSVGLRAGRRRGPAVARRPDLHGRRRGRRARRLLLRRLPARRRDRALLAGHGVGDRVRRTTAGSVLGICNGFQVLCEAGLLPGALLPNVGLRFLCRQVDTRGRRPPTRRSRRQCRRATSCRFRSSTRPAATSRPTTSSTSWPTGPGRAALRAGPEPQRLARDIAGVCNAARNVFGPDAPSRARGRPADRLDRRAEAVRVDARRDGV